MRGSAQGRAHACEYVRTLLLCQTTATSEGGSPSPYNVCVRVCVCAHGRVCVCMCVCALLYIDVYSCPTHTHIYIHMRVCVCVCACARVYMRSTDMSEDDRLWLIWRPHRHPHKKITYTWKKLRGTCILTYVRTYVCTDVCACARACIWLTYVLTYMTDVCAGSPAHVRMCRESMGQEDTSRTTEYTTKTNEIN